MEMIIIAQQNNFFSFKYNKVIKCYWKWSELFSKSNINIDIKS